MNNKLTGAFISERRKELSLSQKLLAEKLNVTDKAVSKWETGRSAPDISLLEPLAEALGVTVVEILKGEKIEKEILPTVSDEIVVKTIKSGKRRLSVTVAVVSFVLIAVGLVGLLFALSYPEYHFLTSVPSDNEEKIVSVVADRFSDIYENTEEMKIVKTEKKGDYYFYLLSNRSGVIMAVFEKDKLFSKRISLMGGGVSKTPDEVGLYCSGERQLTISVFFGYGMQREEYRYIYRGTECEKPVDGEYILDVFIDMNDSWTHPNLIYDR